LELVTAGAAALGVQNAVGFGADGVLEDAEAFDLEFEVVIGRVCGRARWSSRR